jgi:hypothetical protein
MLTLCIHEEKVADIPSIAQQCSDMLQWLGVPQGFEVYLWYIDNPRWIEKTEWPNRGSVNGGWAIPGSNKVFVYREEEWDRVLIHECIHAMNWDWEMPTTPFPCWKFQSEDVLFPHLFEAWTELYAEWLWCGWHNVPWTRQRELQDRQAIQLYARRKTTKQWVEDTNLFSYYILKACLAPHIEFLWSFRNGTTEEERLRVLCGLVTPRLEYFQQQAKQVTPVAMSMRMTVKN